MRPNGTPNFRTVPPRLEIRGVEVIGSGPWMPLGMSLGMPLGRFLHWSLWPGSSQRYGTSRDLWYPYWTYKDTLNNILFITCLRLYNSYILYILILRFYVVIFDRTSWTFRAASVLQRLCEMLNKTDQISHFQASARSHQDCIPPMNKERPWLFYEKSVWIF